MSPEYYIKSTHHSPRNREEGAIRPWQLAESEATANLLNAKENCKKATTFCLDARISADQCRNYIKQSLTHAHLDLHLGW